MKNALLVILVLLVTCSLSLAAPRVKDGIDLYDYKGVDGSVKTFAVKEPGNVDNTMIWTHEPIDSDNHSFLIENVNRGTTVRYFFVKDAEGIKYRGYGSLTGGEPYWFDHPSLSFPDKIVTSGFSWGDAYYNQNFSSETVMYTILGKESVTVEFGNNTGKTYTDCVKIMRVRTLGSDRVAWYAKGVGLVKYIYSSTGGYNLVGYLESIVP